MKRIYIVLITLLSVASASLAQQEAQFTQNMFNHLAINPGYAGLSDAICGTSLAREQWMGFTDPQGNHGNPKTVLLSIDAPAKMLYGGLGATIMQDNLGFEKNTLVKLAYSFHLNAGPGKLGLGINVNFLNKKIDFTKFIPIDPTDPKLVGANESAMFTDFSFGAFYNIPDKLYFGLSSSQLTEKDELIGNSPANITLKRHYYVTAGYHYTLPSNPSFVISPSVFVKSDGASTQFDINGLLKYNNRFWGGLSYRATDAVALLIGMYPFSTGKYKALKIGYSYDFITSALGRDGRSSGSHEIMLGYCFTIEVKRPPQSYKNVRFL